MSELYLNIVRSRTGLGYPQTARYVKKAVAATLSAEGVDTPCAVEILLTDDETIHAINREHRNVDRPTDVLSFPMNELTPGAFDADLCEYDYERACILLGDMVISMERCAAQAEEFGHSFAGLADEYFYDDGTDQYDLYTEPWEPNITTLVNFDSKWKDLVEKSGIVTKADQRLPAYRTLVESDYKVGIYEGGGYLSEGIYRPYPTCRMRDNTYPLFCPVCRRAISRMIDYQTISISK